jgi:hypothetical protein
MMVDGWAASGWLGLLTAGKLWTPLTTKDTFEKDVVNLVVQIGKEVADDTGDTVETADEHTTPEEDFSVVEMRSELERLRAKTESAKATTGASDQCALPADVMELPSGIQVSEEMRTLLDKLTSSDRCVATSH